MRTREVKLVENREREGRVSSKIGQVKRRTDP